MRWHYRATLRLGIPLVLAQIGQVVIGFADSAMVGHYSLSGLAAASFCVNLYNLPIVFLLGFSYGLTPLIGQLTGRHDTLGAGAMFRVGLRWNLGLGIAVTAIMALLYLFIDHMGQPSALLPHIKGYYLLQLASLPFVALFNAFKQFTDALGRTGVSMWIMLSCNLLNIIGNWLLIFGVLGCPEMGLLGAGVATLGARVAMVIIYALRFAVQRRFLRYRVGYFRHKLGAGTGRIMASMGGFIALQMGLETALFSLSIIMIGWLGELPLAAHHVAVTVQTLGFMIYYGAGAAASIRVAHYWGQGNIVMVRRAARSGLQVVLSFAVVMSLLMLLFRYPLAGLFTTSKDVIALATTLLLVGIAYQPADALQVAYANVLKGVGASRSLASVALVGYIIVALPLAYLLAFPAQLGAVGVWLAFPIGLGLAGLGYARQFHRIVRTHIKQR